MKQNGVALLRTRNSIYNSGFPLVDHVPPQKYAAPCIHIHMSNNCNEKQANIHKWMNNYDIHLFADRKDNLHTIENLAMKYSLIYP